MKKLTGDDIPKALREIPQPPKQLYIVGELPNPQLIHLTVVGSRNHTSYGKDMCIQLIEALAGYPVVIVSGLANGIDTIAHETALRIGLLAIGFPGSGLDPRAIYPSASFKLSQEIVAKGGCLVSEFEPLMRGQEWMFPQRNRLMAGISKATLLIEATIKSGTMITAKLTTEYNRDLLVLPGPINSENSKGTNFFLRYGAVPITKPDDLLAALGFDVEHTSGPTQQRLDAILECTPGEKAVLEALIEPTERDELCRKLGKPIHEVNMTITIMELKGLIKEEYGEIRRI